MTALFSSEKMESGRLRQVVDQASANTPPIRRASKEQVVCGRLQDRRCLRMEHDPFKLIILIEVRFSDLDALGHVNNVTYFTYFEIARVKYLYTVSGKPVTIDDIKLVMVEANCRYRSQAQLSDVLEVGVRVSHMRRSSFVFEYRICRSDDGRLIAEGRTVQTIFDHQGQRMAPIADSFREQVERFEQRTFNVGDPIPPWEPREREIERIRHP